MSDVFEEVEESLRQDKLLNFWLKIRWWAIGLAVLMVLGTLVHGLYGQYTERQIDTRTRSFEAALAALEARDYPTAISGFEALANSGTSIAPLAASYLAQARIDGEGDVEAASRALQIAIDGDDKTLSDLSRIKLAYLRADTAELAELETLLRPLLNQGNQMEAMALEVIAAKAYATGDFTRARKEYGYLQISPNSPVDLKQRAEQALSVMPPATDAAAESETPADPDAVTDDADAEVTPETDAGTE